MPPTDPTAPADLPVIRADVLVISAHPQMEHSRINRRLRQAVAGLPADARVLLRDLYALYPDYSIDVAAEQSLLASAKLIVWQHPIHWYSMPPLMKLWVDEVLAFGWAYGPGGTALRGKDLWLVATTGGPEDSYRTDGYNRHPFAAFLPAYEQTAALCGLRFLPPLLLHGAHRVDEAAVARHVAGYRQRLLDHPHWPELDRLLYRLPTSVPEDARPDDDRDDHPPGAMPADARSGYEPGAPVAAGAALDPRARVASPDR